MELPMMNLRYENYRKHLRSGDKLFGLTTPDEQAWCRWFGAEGFTGEGVIVELGTWLGSLTTSYCEGLSANPKTPTGHPVAYAYDLFRWEEWCENEAAGSEHAGKVPIGQSYLDYFKKLHDPYMALLDVRAADLATCTWEGGDIELLLNDAAKTLDVAQNVFREFVPELIPGLGLFANQDYLWPTDSFLAIPMYLARNSLRYEYTVPTSCMVVFRCEEALTEPLSLPSDLTEVDPALIEEAFAWSRRTVKVSPPELIDLGHAVTLWQGGFTDRARRLVRDAKLGAKRADLLYDFQIDALHSWGYGELLSAD